MTTELAELIALTVVLGGITAWASHRQYRSLATGAVVFWVAWVILLVSGAMGIAVGALPPLPDNVPELIIAAYAGAFPGGLVAILIAPDPPRDPDRRFLTLSEWIVGRALLPYVMVMAVAGLVHFIGRWSEVGYDIWRMYELRLLALSGGWSLASRVASYFSYIGFLLVVLCGALDAAHRIRIGRLIAVWLAGMPHGLAYGGRGWTLAPLLLYAFSHLITRRVSAAPQRPRSLRPLLTVMLIGGWLFVSLGIIRRPESSGVASLSPAAWEQEETLMLSNWIGSSLIALGPHADYARRQDPSWGQMTFEYFWTKAANVGTAVETARLKWQSWATRELPSEPRYGFTWCVPPTALPYLLLDYGLVGLPFAMAIIVAVLHVATVKAVGRSLLGQVVALLAFNALFSTIQQLTIVSSSTVVPLAFALLLSFATRRWRLTIQRPQPAMPIARTAGR